MKYKFPVPAGLRLAFFKNPAWGTQSSSAAGGCIRDAMLWLEAKAVQPSVDSLFAIP